MVPFSPLILCAYCSWQVMVWKSNFDVDYGDVKVQRPPPLASSTGNLVSGLAVRAWATWLCDGHNKQHWAWRWGGLQASLLQERNPGKVHQIILWALTPIENEQVRHKSYRAAVVSSTLALLVGSVVMVHAVGVRPRTCPMSAALGSQDPSPGS